MQPTITNSQQTRNALLNLSKKADKAHLARSIGAIGIAAVGVTLFSTLFHSNTLLTPGHIGIWTGAGAALITSLFLLKTGAQINKELDKTDFPMMRWLEHMKASFTVDEEGTKITEFEIKGTGSDRDQMYFLSSISDSNYALKLCKTKQKQFEKLFTTRDIHYFRAHSPKSAAENLKKMGPSSVDLFKISTHGSPSCFLFEERVSQSGVLQAALLKDSDILESDGLINTLADVVKDGCTVIAQACAVGNTKKVNGGIPRLMAAAIGKKKKKCTVIAPRTKISDSSVCFNFKNPSATVFYDGQNSTSASTIIFKENSLAPKAFSAIKGNLKRRKAQLDQIRQGAIQAH